VLLVALAAVVVYLNSIPGDFVFDDKLIQRDPRIHGQTSFWTIFVTDYWYQFIGTQADLYRPLTIASYALNYAVAGLNSAAFHAVNVALHAMVCALLLVLIDALLHDRVLALVSGLLFATHPIHTEAVTSIVGRAEILVALFLLVALYLHARRYVLWGLGRGVWLPVALIAYFCGLLSKETAIVGLGLVLLVEWVLRADNAPRGGRLQQASTDAASLRPAVMMWALYATVSAVYLVIRYRVLGQFVQKAPPKEYYLLMGQPLATRLLTGFKILAIYLKLLVFPLTLSADYSYRQVPLVSSLDSLGAAIGFVAAVCICGTFVWVMRRRVLPAAFALGFFLVSYAVVSNLLVPIGVLVAERLMYLPSVGFCVGIAWFGLALCRRYGTEETGAPILAVVLLLYGGRTFMRNLDWRDQETLFAATAEASPDCHAAHFNYAAVLLQTSKRSDAKELALKQLLKAYEIRQDHYPTLVNLTMVYLDMGQLQKAKEAAMEGLKVHPDSEKLRSLLQTIEKRLGEGGAGS
jgi:tetratricopeptide (TPR) repeat protein